MTGLFRSLSIRRTLVAIVMIGSVVGVALACAIFATYDTVTFRHRMVTKLALEAEIAGANSTGALAFGDEVVATRTLGALAADARLLSARLYRTDGRLLAEYRRPDAGLAPISGPGADGERFLADRLQVQRPIVLAGERIGTVVLESDLSAIRARLVGYAGIVLVVLLLSSIATFVVSSRLQRVISGPIDDLVRVAKSVSTGHDYSIRAVKRTANEIGVLIDGFNEMLAQVEKRDDALQAARDLLEARVDERTAELRAEIEQRRRTQAALELAKDAAEAAARAKSQFLANMSHEIRTPMNAVVGMTGLLLETELSEEQREYAETIRTGSETLLTVINDVLDFSKMESGRLELERQPFDLRDSIESALDLVAPVAADKALDLAYVLDDTTPIALVGDAARLRQILVNLLGNAVKFTPAGEVVVSVSARHREGRSHEIELAVCDTGIGIPADRRDRLFQAFTAPPARIRSRASRSPGRSPG
jgi:signal transduction histidine kinase